MEKAEKQTLKTTKPVEKLTCRHVFVQGNKKGTFCGRNCRGDRCKDHKLTKLNKKRVELDNDILKRIKNTGSIKNLPPIQDLEFKLWSLRNSRHSLIKQIFGVRRYLGEDTEKNEEILKKIILGKCRCEDPYAKWCAGCESYALKYEIIEDEEGSHKKLTMNDCIFCKKSHDKNGYIEVGYEKEGETKYCTKCKEYLTYAERDYKQQILHMCDHNDVITKCHLCKHKVDKNTAKEYDSDYKSYTERLFNYCKHDNKLDECCCEKQLDIHSYNKTLQYCYRCDKNVEYHDHYADQCKYCFKDYKTYIEYEGRSEEHAIKYLAELKDRLEKNNNEDTLLRKKIKLIKEKMNELVN